MKPTYRPGPRTGLLLAAVTQTRAGAVAAVRHTDYRRDAGAAAGQTGLAR